MNEKNAKFDQLLDAFLHDEINKEEQVSFLKQLQEDNSLRSEFEKQKTIDDSLKRIFSTSMGEIPTTAQLRNGFVTNILKSTDNSKDVKQSRPVISRFKEIISNRGILAVAAGFALVIAGAWLIFSTLVGKNTDYEIQPWRSLTTVYNDTVAAGFKEDWLCETDEEFLATFKDEYSQQLHTTDLPEGFEALGLSYCNSITPKTTTVLFMIEDKPVMVFIDRVERDMVQQEIPEIDLYLHRRTIGRIVLYEIGPFEEEVVLPYFETPGINE